MAEGSVAERKMTTEEAEGAGAKRKMTAEEAATDTFSSDNTSGFMQNVSRVLSQTTEWKNDYCEYLCKKITENRDSKWYTKRQKIFIQVVEKIGVETVQHAAEKNASWLLFFLNRCVAYKEGSTGLFMLLHCVDTAFFAPGLFSIVEAMKEKGCLGEFTRYSFGTKDVENRVIDALMLGPMSSLLAAALLSRKQRTVDGYRKAWRALTGIISCVELLDTATEKDLKLAREALVLCTAIDKAGLAVKEMSGNGLNACIESRLRILQSDGKKDLDELDNECYDLVKKCREWDESQVLNAKEQRTRDNRCMERDEKCNEFIRVIEKQLLPYEYETENRLAYGLRIGHFRRYMCEYRSNRTNEGGKAAQKAEYAYRKVMKTCELAWERDPTRSYVGIETYWEAVYGCCVLLKDTEEKNEDAVMLATEKVKEHDKRKCPDGGWKISAHLSVLESTFIPSSESYNGDM